MGVMLADRKIPLGRLILYGVLFMAIVLCLLIAVDTPAYIGRFFTWLDTLGPWGPFLFILLDALIVVFVLPGIFFTFGAGFLFGVIKGSFYVVIATTLGGTISFVVARYFFSARLSAFFLSHPRLECVNNEFRCSGWKIILLTRLVPFFPFKLSNYFFGVTQFTLRDFVLGTVIGIIPITVTNVYLGSITADLTTLLSGASPRSPVSWFVYGLGFVATIIALVFFTRLAKKGLNAYMPEGLP